MRLVKPGAAAICALLLHFGSGCPAAAQANYPSQMITMIVPFAAGGSADLVARVVAESMSRTLSQHIVIEYVVGAGGTTAATRTMRAAPDGYTVMIGTMGTHAAAVALHAKLSYDPATDFAPIGMIVGTPVLVLARKATPADDLAGFIAYAKQNAATLTMAHAGVGTVSHVSCLLLDSIMGVRPRMVAFQGTGPAMNALVTGKVDFMCDQVVSVVPRARAGSIRVYAVGTPGRNPALPDVPTAAEAGVPAFQVSAWNGLFAPRGTPRPIVDRLNAALGKALDDKAVRANLLDLGSDIADGDMRSPEALGRLVRSEIAKWTPIIRQVSPAE